jgi:eukaryotic-like serine/threonine-protein kinase
MQPSPVPPTKLRFGPFEVHLVAAELRKRGRKVPLQDQPFKVLALLLQRPGELITREELQRALWPGDTFGEFDEGLNKAIQKLRQALDDSTDKPQFIETLPRKGYRFIATLESEPDVAVAQVVPDIPAKRRHREVLAWALLAAVSLALVILAIVHVREEPPEVRPARFLVPPSEGAKEFRLAVVSPDGQRLAIVGINAKGERLLWLRSLDSPLIRPLAGTEQAFFPFWSPDSRFIVFSDGRKLKKIDVSAGPPQILCDTSAFVGGSWSREGIILFSDADVLKSISAEGRGITRVRQLDKSAHETAQDWPHFLPDGRHFLYHVHSTEARKSGIYLGSLDSKENRLLVSAESNTSYTPPGLLIYHVENTLMAQPFDMRRLRVTGEPFRVAEQVDTMHVAASKYSVSQNGVLVYSGAPSRDVQLAWYSRDGKRLGSVGEPGLYGEIVLSPDERRLAVERVDPQLSTLDLWVLELASGIFSRLTFNPANDENPVWSPNGRELVFSSDRKGEDNLYRQDIGGGEEKLLFESGESKYPFIWFNDGQSILFINQNGRSFYQLPLTGDRRPVTLLKSDFDKDEPHISPDGQWVAYNSNESGRWQVYVAAFPTFTERRQVSVSSGCQPRWGKDGKELFYLDLDGKLVVVEVKGGKTFQGGVPQVLFQTPAIVSPKASEYCATADGKRFIFREPVGESTMPVTVVLNWTAGLKR